MRTFVSVDCHVLPCMPYAGGCFAATYLASRSSCRTAMLPTWHTALRWCELCTGIATHALCGGTSRCRGACAACHAQQRHRLRRARTAGRAARPTNAMVCWLRTVRHCTSCISITPPPELEQQQPSQLAAAARKWTDLAEQLCGLGGRNLAAVLSLADEALCDAVELAQRIPHRNQARLGCAWERHEGSEQSGLRTLARGTVVRLQAQVMCSSLQAVTALLLGSGRCSAELPSCAMLHAFALRAHAGRFTKCSSCTAGQAAAGEPRRQAAA